VEPSSGKKTQWNEWQHFFVVLRIESRSMQQICHLSHVSSPYLSLFCFWGRVLLSLPGLTLNSPSSCFCLPSSWDYKYVPLHPVWQSIF
jgi:hypothetical protein